MIFLKIHWPKGSKTDFLGSKCYFGLLIVQSWTPRFLPWTHTFWLDSTLKIDPADCCCCTLQGYRIYQGGVPPAMRSVWRPMTVDARQTQTIIDDLSADNTYQFQMSAFTDVGSGPLSDPLQVILRSTGSHWLSSSALTLSPTIPLRLYLRHTGLTHHF